MRYCIFPLIVSWNILYWVPVQCQKNQTPDPYVGACLQQGRFQGERRFTEKEDYEKWVKGIPKNDQRFSIQDIEVYEFDDRRTPLIK